MVKAYQDYYNHRDLPFNAYRKNDVLANIMRDSYGNYYTKQCPTRVGYELVRDYLGVYFEVFMKNVSCPIFFVPSGDEIKELSVTKALNVFESLLKTLEVTILKGSHYAETMFDIPQEISDTIKRFYKSITL